MPEPDDFYTDSQRQFQKDHDSYNLANAVVDAIVSDDIQDKQVGNSSSSTNRNKNLLNFQIW